MDQFSDDIQFTKTPIAQHLCHWIEFCVGGSKKISVDIWRNISFCYIENTPAAMFIWNTMYYFWYQSATHYIQKNHRITDFDVVECRKLNYYSTWHGSYGKPPQPLPKCHCRYGIPEQWSERKEKKSELKHVYQKCKYIMRHRHLKCKSLICAPFLTNWIWRYVELNRSRENIWFIFDAVCKMKGEKKSVNDKFTRVSGKIPCEQRALKQTCEELLLCQSMM